MKLQLALDGDLQSSLAVLDGVYPYIDIVEIGTPLIFREGVAAIRQICKKHTQIPCLADLKIMDAGYMEAAIAFEAGAQYVTVLGVTQDATIEGALKAATEFGGDIIVDMMQVYDFKSRSHQLSQIGCQYLCVHTAHDIQSQNNLSIPSYVVQTCAELPAIQWSIAGGITSETITIIRQLQPAIVVVGSAITQSNDPELAARTIKQAMQELQS